MYPENPMPITSSAQRPFLLLAALALSGPVLVHPQQPSARNVFWSASDLVQVSKNPGAKPAAFPPQTAPKKPSTPPSHAGPQIDPEQIAQNGYGAPPQQVIVSHEQIGIRYALLLRDSDGHYNEVSPATIFHSGDHLRLSVMANQPGYFYVIEQGSTGSWKSIYPSKHAGNGAEAANRIEPGSVYQVPGKEAFLFDQHPGQEKLFLVLSRQRIADLDAAINSRKQSGQPSAAPTHPEPPAAQGEMRVASNTISDDVVQKLSGRDLNLVEEETVDQAQSGEKAVYVVSKVSDTKNESPRVVASVTLRHE
jgi:hypothetical protein